MPDDIRGLTMTPGRTAQAFGTYLRGLWRMGRPLFVLGTLPFYLLGAAAAWRDGGGIQRPSVLAVGLLVVWLVQLMTHYNNEYRDLDTDLATEHPTLISGGSRVLVEGLVPVKLALAAAVGCLLAAVALTVVLVGVLGAGKLAAAFAGAAIILGWFYSAPPLGLKANGAGEVTIALVAAYLLPGFAYYLETSQLSLGLLLVATPLALLSLALALGTELPDVAADRSTGRMTLAARLGLRKAVYLWAALFVVGWASVAAAIVRSWPYWGWAALVPTLPLGAMALAHARRSSRGAVKAMERMGLGNSLVLGFSTLALAAGLVLG